MMRRFLLISLGVALSLVSCSPNLVILHVNDTHSHLEPLRGGVRDGRGGIIERAAIVDSIRLSDGAENVLLVHAGDFNQGSSYYTVLGGHLEVDLVNAMGYDCITLGNHEFDNGMEDLASRLEKLDTRIVCANVDFSGTPLENLVAPYAVIDRAGRKIGIIGLTTRLGSNVSRELVGSLVQYDNARTVNKWARHLRRVEKCDMVILLTHIGYGQDIRLVPYIKGVDMVIGGHSHTLLDDFTYVRDMTGKKVPVISDGEWGLQMGRIVVK